MSFPKGLTGRLSCRLQSLNGVQKMTAFKLWVARHRLQKAARREAHFRFYAEKAKAALPDIEQALERAEVRAYLAGQVHKAV